MTLLLLLDVDVEIFSSDYCVSHSSTVIVQAVRG